MEASLYAILQKPGTEAAQALSLLEDKQAGRAAGVQVASAHLNPHSVPVASTRLLSRLNKHVRVECGQYVYYAFQGTHATSVGCGQTLNGLPCYRCAQKCAIDHACPVKGQSKGPVFHTAQNGLPDKARQQAKADPPAFRQATSKLGSSLPAASAPSASPVDKPAPIQIASAAGDTNRWGAQAGDPVNLASGAEEYAPDPDLSVYNPIGPSVSFARLYSSLRPTTNAYHQHANLGWGWSHNYSVGVLATVQQSYSYGSGGYTITTSLSGYVLEPNGARVAISAASVPTASTPHVSCTVQAGLPMLVDAYYNSSATLPRFVITYADRSQWTFLVNVASTASTGYGSVVWYAPTKIADSVGNYITLNYTAAPSSQGGAYFPALLTSIKDSNNVALLSFTYSATTDNTLVSIADRYNRSVYYHASTYSGYVSVPELDHVSQIVTTGTSSPPDRYVYGYQNVNNAEAEGIPLLHTITVPSPTGTGTQTATINYEDTTMGVTSLVDANGNSRSYQQIDASHTQVTVKDSASTILYRYTAGYDSAMNATTITNGVVNGTGQNTQVISASTYADPSTPYGASQVQDGVGYAASGAGGQGTWTYTFDAYGHCLTATMPRGTTTTNTYSFTNFALGELTSVHTSGKQATSFTYYQPSGFIHTVTSPLPGTSNGTSNVSTTYTYTTLGNIATVTTPGNGTVSSQTTTYGYTSDGTYSQTEALGQPITVMDNLSKVSHARYDSQDRVTSASDALGNAASVSYNIAGQVTQTLLPATGQTGTGQGATQNTYLYPGGPVSQTAVYDESGTQIRYVNPTYGKEGEQTGATGNVNPVTTTYDGMYRTKTLTDGNSHATTTTFNSSGYAGQSQLANGNTYQATSWDADGHVTSTTDAKGVVVNYVYNDIESCLTDIQYPASTSLNVHITYDSYGRPTGVTDSTGSKSVSYDDNNLPTGSSVTYLNAAGTGNLPTLSLSYSYNADGSRSGLTTPAGSFSYTYDGRGLPSAVSNPSSESFGWTYLDNGWLWTQTLGSAATSTYTYNALGEVTDLAHVKTSTSATLAEFSSLGYDGVGNRTSLSASVPSVSGYGGSTSYTYDVKNQLTQESSTRAGSYTNNYAFDLVSNPTTWKGSSQSFNSANQNTYAGTLSFDANGNPAGYGGVSLTWDANNKLTAVGSILTAGYGADGLRAWKQNSSGRTYFLYDGLTPVCETDGSGNVTAVNTWGVNGLLARHTSSGSVFYTFDPQGSVSVRLNTSGTVLSSHCNEAWGTQVSTGSGYGSDPYAGYGGQWGYYRDSETGLHLLGHRYYDTSSGRFLNRDPAGYGGGINLYGYCYSSPLNGIDPTGLMDSPGVIGDVGQKGGGAELSGTLGWGIGGNFGWAVGYGHGAGWGPGEMTSGVVLCETALEGGGLSGGGFAGGDEEFVYMRAVGQEEAETIQNQWVVPSDTSRLLRNSTRLFLPEYESTIRGFFDMQNADALRCGKEVPYQYIVEYTTIGPLKGEPDFGKGTFTGQPPTIVVPVTHLIVNVKGIKIRVY